MRNLMIATVSALVLTAGSAMAGDAMHKNDAAGASTLNDSATTNDDSLDSNTATSSDVSPLRDEPGTGINCPPGRENCAPGDVSGGTTTGISGGSDGSRGGGGVGGSGGGAGSGQ
ncbi:hypothetical protein [Azospirillum sp. ST 5-10]|uniref:hypothetical protein n=1 Tax=unclassified Azospirillum TaxID=2630922 RepID=UPI003F4A0E2D